MKWFLCSVICLAMLLSCMALPMTQAEELPYYEIDVFSQNANFAGLQSGWFGKLIKDKFNIGLNITATNLEGGASKLATLMVEGDLGDLLNFASVTSADFTDARDLGLLFDMNQGDFLEKNAPFITANMPNLIKRAQIQYSGDGKAVWAFVHDALVSGLSCSSVDAVTPVMRYDLYKAIGSPEIKDMWDYLPALKKMQELNPVNEDGQPVYGVSYFPDWDGRNMVFATWFCAYNGYNFNLVMQHGTEDVTAELLDKDSYYIQGLRWMFEANQMGLLDPDSITQSYSEYAAKFAAGRVLFSPYGDNGYNTPANTAAGRGMEPVPMTSGTPFAWGASEFGGYRTFGIGAKAEYPERILQFIDWLCTDEGAMESRIGPKGLIWDYNADGKAELTEFGLQCVRDGSTPIPDEWGGGTYQDGMFKLEYPPRNAKSITATTGEAIDYHCWSSYQALPSDPVTEQWREDYGAANIFEWAKNNGTLINSCNESYSGLAGLTNPDPDLELMINQIGDVVKQYSWKMAYAESEAEFDRLYDEMMTKVKGFGYDEVMEYYRAETEKLYKTRAELSKSIQ